MNVQNGKNRSATFTILRHLHRASRGKNGYIEFTFLGALGKIKALKDDWWRFAPPIIF